MPSVICPHLQVRPWEKQLQQIYDENNALKLTKLAEESTQHYIHLLPKTNRKCQYKDGNSPLDHLTHASHCYATAIKYKGKDANLHLQLGLVLEEIYYAEDIVGLNKPAQVGTPIWWMRGN